MGSTLQLRGVLMLSEDILAYPESHMLEIILAHHGSSTLRRIVKHCL